MHSSSIKIGGKINDGCNDHDHWAGGHVRIIRNDQSQDSRENREQHGKEVIFPHILGDVPGSRRRQDQQCIDDEDPHPLDGQHDDQRHQHRKQVLQDSHRNVLALRQRPVQAHGLDPVAAQAPEHQRHPEDDQQIYDFPACNAENVSHQQTGILAEIAAPGQDGKPNGNAEGRKHRDYRIGSCRIPAADLV